VFLKGYFSPIASKLFATCHSSNTRVCVHTHTHTHTHIHYCERATCQNRLVPVSKRKIKMSVHRNKKRQVARRVDCVYESTLAFAAVASAIAAVLHSRQN
jgi:hypothetical protein